jgi:DNA-binding response OmpR family regulator
VEKSRNIVGGDEAHGHGGVMLMSASPERDHIARVLTAARISVATTETLDLRGAADRSAALLVDLDNATHPDQAWRLIEQEGSRAGAQSLIVLTAAGRRRDASRALEAGADDVVTRPLCDSELSARIRTTLSRTNEPSSDAADFSSAADYSDDSLSINFAAYSATFQGRRATLSTLEARLLQALVGNPGRLLTQEELLDLVWGGQREVSKDQVKLYVSYVRRKLGMSAQDGPIFSVRGRGYRFDPVRSTGRRGK